MFFDHTSQYETSNGCRRLNLVKRRRIWCIMEYRGEDSYVPHHLVFWSDFLSVTFQLSSMQKDGVTTVWQRCGYTVLVYRCVKHRQNSPPTSTVLYFWLDCCYTLWLCFTTWICVFYVLTSGCLYSVLFVIIYPQCVYLYSFPRSN